MSQDNATDFKMKADIANSICSAIAVIAVAIAVACVLINGCYETEKTNRLKIERGCK